MEQLSGRAGDSLSRFFYALCFLAWDPSTNRVTYMLYRRLSQEHLTPIERIPDSAFLPTLRRCRPKARGVPFGVPFDEVEGPHPHPTTNRCAARERTASADQIAERRGKDKHIDEQLVDFAWVGMTARPAVSRGRVRT